MKVSPGWRVGMGGFLTAPRGGVVMKVSPGWRVGVEAS